MHKIITQLIQTSGAKFYSLILGVLSLTITARWLGPDGRGIAAAVATWITAFSTFGHFSLSQVSIKNASNSQGLAWLRESLPVFLITILLSFVISIVIVFLVNFLGIEVFGSLEAKYVLIILIAFPFYILEIYLSTALVSAGHLKRYNFLLVFSRSISIVLLIFLVLKLEMGAFGLIVSNLAAQIIICSGSFMTILGLIDSFKMPSIATYLKYLREGCILHLNTIGTFLFTGGDILLLNYLRGSKETGLYQLSAQLISVLMIIPQSASLIFYSQVSSKGSKLAWIEQRKMILLLTGSMCIIALLSYITVDFWLPLVAGREFVASTIIFKWQLVTLIAMSFCTMLSAQWISRGFFWQSSLIALTVGALNMFANKLLIPKFGMLGAAWASLGTFTIAFLVNLVFYLSITKKDMASSRLDDINL